MSERLAGTSPAGQPRPPVTDNVAVPAQNRGWGHDQPQLGQAPGRQRPGEQRQPRPVRPRQPRMSPRPLTQGHRKLMTQHQDLGVLPPRLPPRQAQHRHDPGDDREGQLQAHKPNIIARQPEPGRPPGTVRVTEPTASRKASAQVAQVFGTHRPASSTATSAPTPSGSPTTGERQRAGEAISTAFTESAVNQVISKRMVKKQQMRWTPRGAHLLLQIRTRVLNDQLAGDFHRWCPGLNRTLDPVTLAA
jgi:hypothetical protein